MYSTFPLFCASALDSIGCTKTCHFTSTDDRIAAGSFDCFIRCFVYVYQIPIDTYKYNVVIKISVISLDA